MACQLHIEESIVPKDSRSIDHIVDDQGEVWRQVGWSFGSKMKCPNCFHYGYPCMNCNRKSKHPQRIIQEIKQDDLCRNCAVYGSPCLNCRSPGSDEKPNFTWMSFKEYQAQAVDGHLYQTYEEFAKAKAKWSQTKSKKSAQ